MDGDRFAARCMSDLREVGILANPPRGKTTYSSHRIRRLYPVYESGWRQHLDGALESLDRIENLYLVGRPALYLHCNVDHCIAMALQLARLVSDGNDHRDEWRIARRRFHEFALHD